MPEEKYMRRAIELAKKGSGHVNPNPLVGAVIVRDGEIIGEGNIRAMLPLREDPSLYGSDY